MKKTSIYLDEDLDARLADAAARERMTKAQFIRRSLEAAVGQPPRLVGRGSFAGPADLSTDERHHGALGDWRPS